MKKKKLGLQLGFPIFSGPSAWRFGSPWQDYCTRGAASRAAIRATNTALAYTERNTAESWLCGSLYFCALAW